MIANELMIGDCVIRKNVPKEILIVVAIDPFRNIVYLDLDGLGITEKLENIEPVLLTTKTLEKNFPTIEDGVTWGETADSDLFNIRVEYDKYVEGIFKYVHELQHALRLAGIEKEIEL